MFGRKKKSITFSVPYDPQTQVPVIKSSICTGEQVAGFKDLKSGRVTEVVCIKSPQDLENFVKFYGLEDTDIQKIY